MDCHNHPFWMTGSSLYALTGVESWVSPMSDFINVSASDASIDGVVSTNASEAADSIRLVPRSKIKADHARNPRKSRRYSAKELSAIIRSLIAHGLHEPLVLSERADGTLWVLKGHRRLAAIDLIRTEGIAKDVYGPALAADPNFMDKIKCRVLKGLTIQAEMDILMDHGDIVALDRQEKLMTAQILTRYGFSHDFIAGKLGGSRSNYSNGLARVLAMPDCVQTAYLDESDDAPDVTQEVLKPLYDAYKEDQKTPGSRIKTAGPKFVAVWEEFLKNGVTKKAKVMARQSILDVASVTTDPDLRDMLQAIADGNGQDLGTSMERLALRLVDLSTVNTGFKRVEEGIVNTVGSYNHAD